MDKNYHAKQSVILPQMPAIAIPMVSRFFLKKATPQNASGLMSMLPSGLTEPFSDDEKTEFTTNKKMFLRKMLYKILQTGASMVKRLKRRELFRKLQSS